MSNTQDNLIGLSDEALDPAPTQEASGCGRACGTIYCTISDEALDPGPAQKAAVCVCAVSPCYVTDEALDPTPAQAADMCVTCGPICGISDEALDEPRQHALACAGPYCRSTVISEFSAISDEALDPAPAHEAQASAVSVPCMGPCHISDEEVHVAN